MLNSEMFDSSLRIRPKTKLDKLLYVKMITFVDKTHAVSSEFASFFACLFQVQNADTLLNGYVELLARSLSDVDGD
jgi:hypothetical protein